MKHLLQSIIVAAGLLAGTAAHADVIMYDATADFLLTKNASSPWSYGYSPGARANYHFTEFDTVSNGFWRKSDYVYWQTPTVFKNIATATQYGVLPGQIALHSGPVSNGDPAIVRFTAVHAGDYDVLGQFFAGDFGQMNGAIIANDLINNPLQYFANTTNQSTFTLSALHLKAGDTLDFVVGNNGNFGGGSTPLAVTIRGVTAAVPEPGSVGMVLAGLGLIGAVLARKRSAA